MAIPDGKLYMDGELGNGTIATTESPAINTETAGADIGFGAGVVMQDGNVVPATSGNIYGVALKRTYINGDRYADVVNDHWDSGETLGVVRDGTIAVPITEDVDRGDKAAVTTDGKFKQAGTEDTVVGVFLSSGNADGTANLQTRVQLVNNSTPASNTNSTPASKIN